MTDSTNKVRLAHAALLTLVQALWPSETVERNPGGYVEPKARVAGQLTPYLSLEDDTTPEELGALCGPLYELSVSPKLVLAFTGLTKDERQNAAYIRLDQLTAELALDRTLGGVVDHAEIEAADPCDADNTHWMAGGLEVRIGLLLTAPTKAG